MRQILGIACQANVDTPTGYDRRPMRVLAEAFPREPLRVALTLAGEPANASAVLFGCDQTLLMACDLGEWRHYNGLAASIRAGNQHGLALKFTATQTRFHPHADRVAKMEITSLDVIEASRDQRCCCWIEDGSDPLHANQLEAQMALHDAITAASLSRLLADHAPAPRMAVPHRVTAGRIMCCRTITELHERWPSRRSRQERILAGRDAEPDVEPFVAPIDDPQARAQQLIASLGDDLPTLQALHDALGDILAKSGGDAA